MDTSILPEDLEETTVDQLVEGQGGFTVPWAIWVDLNRQMWIHPKYSVSPTSGGTVHMHIHREGSVIIVDRNSIGDHRYIPKAEPGFVSPPDTKYLPVTLR